MRYLRSLSFIQGTAVNFLRTSILFLMLYLIFTQQITVGQFFSLFIYSFFIFGPLQELGNVINTYRETEASLANFEAILAISRRSRRPSQPVAVGPLTALAFDAVGFQASDGVVARADRHLVRGQRAARRSPSSGRRARARRRSSSCWWDCTRRRRGRILYNGEPSTDVDLEQLRERIGFVTQDTQLFSGTIRENLLFVNPDGHRTPSASRCCTRRPATACWRAPTGDSTR